MERPDGYKGLAATYGLRFAEAPRIMDLGLLTRALKEKQVDLIAGNTTDGLIPALDLVRAGDDRNYFPPLRGGGRNAAANRWSAIPKLAAHSMNWLEKFPIRTCSR